MNKPPADFCYWVERGRLLAGAYPGDRDPEICLQKITPLLDAGVSVFLSLMEEDETSHGGVPFSPYAACALQQNPATQFVRFAIKDYSIPTPAEMRAILDKIDELLATGETIYLHCWGGLGRTGTVVGCWLLRHQLATADNVLAVLKELRQHDKQRGWQTSPQTPQQCEFVTGWQG